MSRLLLGILLGVTIGVVVVVYFGISPVNPGEVCDEQLGDEWSPNGVQTSTQNDTIYVTCEAPNGTVKRVDSGVDAYKNVTGVQVGDWL